MILPIFIVLCVLLVAAVVVWRNMALKADRRTAELDSKH
jgi:hypothetical protein